MSFSSFFSGARPRAPRRFHLMTGAALAGTLVAAACVPAPEPGAGEPAGPPRPGVATPAASWITPGERLGIGGCPLFPTDHAWHATVTGLERHPDSDRMIAATGPELPARPRFGAKIARDGTRSGIPYNVVDGSTVKRVDVIVTRDHSKNGAGRGVPIPDGEVKFEGWPGKSWDRHVVIVDTSTCESRELFYAREPADDLLGIGGGNWWAAGAGTFDMRSNEPGDGNATAGNQSLMAGMVRYEEVAAGRVDHALTMTLYKIRQGEPLWPAMGTDGRSEDPDAIPMGSWLRLKADTDLSALGPQARIVAEALQRHGAVVMDTTGHSFAFQGEPHPDWDDADVKTLSTLTLSDFEVIDASPMMASPDSYQLRQPG